MDIFLENTVIFVKMPNKKNVYYHMYSKKCYTIYYIFSTLLFGCSRSGVPFRYVFFDIGSTISRCWYYDWATLLEEEVSISKNIEIKKLMKIIFKTTLLWTSRRVGVTKRIRIWNRNLQTSDVKRISGSWFHQNLLVRNRVPDL